MNHLSKHLIFIFFSFFLYSTSLHAASYSCDGEKVSNVHDALTDAIKSYSEDRDNRSKRYFKFRTKVDGEITISFDETNKDQRMRIGTSCGDRNDDDIHSGDRKKSDSHTFSVTANTYYYTYMEEKNGDDDLKFTITFDFTAAVTIAADISISEYSSPSLTTVNVAQGVTFYTRVLKDSSQDSEANIVVEYTYNEDVVFQSVTQEAGGTEFQNCNKLAGDIISAGSKITCTKTSTLATGAPNKDIAITVSPTTAGTLIQTATLLPTTFDPDTSNNTATSTTVTVNAVISNYSCSNPHAFTLREQFVLTGDLIAIGNSSICADTDYDGNCDTDQIKRNDIDNIIFINSGSSAAVASEPGSLENTSGASLNLPDGATIIWAGLYWQGEIWDFNTNNTLSTNTNGRRTGAGNTAYTVEIENGAKGQERQANEDKIKFKLPGGSYIEYIADEHYWVNLKRNGKLDYNGISNRYESHYQGFLDVTGLLQSLSSPNGEYFVGDIQATPGLLKYPGVEAAWSLQVVYRVATESVKSIAITDGYVALYGSASDGENYVTDVNDKYSLGCLSGFSNTGVYAYEVSFDVGGFLTPKTPGFITDLSIFVTESDPDSGSNAALPESLSVTKKDGTPVIVEGPPAETWAYEITNKDGTDNLDRSPAYIYPIGTTIKNYRKTDLLDIEQTSTTVTFRTDSDKLILGVIGFATELRSVDLCFDYTYGQNGSFLTAANLTDPTISDTFIATDPIDVKFYFENLEDSDVIIKNLVFNVNNIDTSAVTYKANSTAVTRPNSSFTTVSDAGRDTADSHNKDLFVGNVDSLENFYTYYSLNQVDASGFNDVNTSLDVELVFDLKIKVDGVYINLGSNPININSMNPCTLTGTYEPVPGVFNVAHDSQVNSSLSTGYYNNLPTQVVKRSGNYKMQSFDPDATDILKDTTAIVAIEMVDVSGFHYATATCTDENVTLQSNSRVWVIFDNNVSLVSINQTDLATAGFFDKAISNAAFRISYNLADDNTSAVQLEEVSTGQYRLTNYSAAAGSVCDNSSMNFTQLTACMEDIYGSRTKRLCSRDNFSIRPESFEFSLYDYDQITQTTKLHLLDNINALPTIDLASGYDYIVEVNATDHFNNPITSSYSPSLVDMNLTWQTQANCNDTSDQGANIGFTNGASTSTILRDQVGKYQLNVTDTVWTSVDYDPALMAHHTGTYFQAATIPDCVLTPGFEDIVQLESFAGYNGCYISSNHTNIEYPSILTPQVYNDINITYHPYKLDVSALVASHGPNFNNVFPTTGDAAWVYMNDLYLDNNMSLNFIGTITARGLSGVQNSNYVTACYANDLTISLNSSVVNTQADYEYRFISSNLDNSILYDSWDTNNSSQEILDLNDTNFATDQNGTVTMRLHYNYDHNVTNAINPEQLNLIGLDVGCTTAAECQMKADLLTTYENNSTVTINAPLNHYYGRTNAPRQTFIAPIGTAANPANPATAFIYYEVYCNVATGCDRNLLQNQATLRYIDDPRWYVNTNHVTTTGGDIGVVSHKTTGTVLVSATNNSSAPVNGQTSTSLVYNAANGYPYKTTMENSASPWLIYNKYDDSMTINEFHVDFINNSGNWAGKHETNTTTDNSAAQRTNRRSMW